MTENRLGLFPVAPQFSESMAVSPRVFWGLLPHKMSCASESRGARDPECTEGEGGPGTGQSGRAPRLWLFTYWGPMATTRHPPSPWGHRNQNFPGWALPSAFASSHAEASADKALYLHLLLTLRSPREQCHRLHFYQVSHRRPRTTQPPRPTQKRRLCKLPMALATTDYSHVT